MNNDFDREINSQKQQRWRLTFFGGVFEEKITSELPQEDLNYAVFPLAACQKGDRASIVPS